MRLLTGLINYIRETFELVDTQTIRPGTSGEQHLLTYEHYRNEAGNEARITFWDGQPAVVERPGFKEITESC